MSIAVIGADASGLAAAIFAARRGVKVELYDSRPGLERRSS